MEIEKKYLVNRIPENLQEYTCFEIEQGYLCASPIVRIRKINDEYILTYKSHKFFKDTPKLAIPDNIIACEEVELPLSEESYEHLCKKVDNNLIRKRRYKIPLYGDYVAELDIFSEHLEGLVVVEVEFRDPLQASLFVKPSWFGEDISAETRYGNASLSRLNRWDE